MPFTSVNDGVCDYDLCCDGSEEWGGLVKCEDRCGGIGKEWRRADEQRQKSLGVAARKRRELVAEAARIKQVVRDRLQSLGTEIQGAESRVRGLEEDLAEIERKDRGKVVRGQVGKGGGKIGVLAGLARERTEELRQSLLRVREERDASRTRLEELEGILSTFKEEYNPNFNDEGVKRAVRAWEDYAARDKGVEPEAARDRDLEEITKSDEDNGLDWAQYEDDEPSETDVCEFSRRHYWKCNVLTRPSIRL